MFWPCLYRRSLPLAALIYWLNPAFFDKDFATIRQLGVTVNQAEFLREVDDYAFAIQKYGNFVQRTFRVRISGQRLLRLCHLFRSAPAIEQKF